MSYKGKSFAALCFALITAFAAAYHLYFSSTQSVNQPPLSIQQTQQTLEQALELWRAKQFSQSSQFFSSLVAQEIDPKIRPLADLYQFYTQAFFESQNQILKNSLTTPEQSCRQQILFVTPDIDSLVQAESFRTQFTQDQRLKPLSICVHDIVWFDPVNLKCKPNWQQSGRLGCNLLSLAAELKDISFTHLVIFSDAGKANVHNGIMFLDSQDTYDVFVHELAHFSGFIDEYPLSKGLAKRVCAGVDAPNVVFRQSTMEQVDKHYWQTMGFDTSTQLTQARTCDNHPTQAYKMSDKLTFMEYHDIAYIPKHYIKAWQRHLQNPPSLPSAHVNFAQLNDEFNNPAESQFWRAKYQQYIDLPQSTAEKL